MPALIGYFGETEANTTYSLANILSNLAFVHRAYTMSYSCAEMFLSVNEPRYVRASNGRARFQAFLPDEHTHGQTLNTLPTEFQTRDLTQPPDPGHSGVESVPVLFKATRRTENAQITV